MNHFTPTLLTLLSSVALAGCPSATPTESASPRAPLAEPAAAEAAAAQPAAAQPAATQPAPTASPAEHIEQLGGKLLALLGERDGNLVISPASLHAALTLLQGAASGATATELDALLGGGADSAALTALAAFHDELGAARPGVTLRAANGLFVREGSELTESYTRQVADPLHARVQALRFDGTAEATINAWASEATDKHIPELIPRDALDPNTAAVLVNALYVQGTWATPFQVEATTPVPFTLGSGSRVELPTMHAELSVPFAETPLVELAQLPYQDGRLAMAFILPKQGHTLDEAFSALAKGELAQALASSRVAKLAVALPRFTVKSPIVRLKAALQALGVSTAFSDHSDFGQLLQAGPPLVLADVMHRVLLEVNERGATAAGVSAAQLKFRSRQAPARPFSVDRPFLIVLRDQKSGAPLFVGRIEDPRG